MSILLLFIAAALTAFALILLTNVALFPRLRHGQPSVPPRLSVLIPARDEAAVIGRTVSSLAAQDYPDFELIVLDDESTDDTGDIALSTDPGVRVLYGAPLPTGWTGKNWACHQLAAAATGDVLLFTDADVIWQPGALAAVAVEMERRRADLLTVWPTQITETWAERLTVPLMALVVLGYLPIVAVHRIPLALFGAANGQCMVWRREAYESVGGHSAVRAAVVEDVALGRLVKRYGLRLRMADGAGLVACRMYDGWTSVRRGFAKSIVGGYGGVVPLLLATIFHWAVFLLPPALVLFGLLPDSPVAHVRSTAFMLSVLGVLVRALSAAATRQRTADALLMPLSVVLMTFIAAQAVIWHLRFGGVRWKGRTIASALAAGQSRSRHPVSTGERDRCDGSI